MSQGWLENFSENLFREIRGKTTELWKVEKERKGCSGKWPLCKPNSPHGIFLWYTPSDASHTSPRGDLAKQDNWKLLMSLVATFPGGLVVKNPPAKAGATGDTGSILGSGRSLGRRNGNPLHYSCLENLTDGGAWQATWILRVRHN